MNSKRANAETEIKQDLDNLPSGVRFFREDDEISINEIIKSILKYFPDSVVLKIQALKEYGKTAILLESENQLVRLSNKLTPNLTMQLKSHLRSNKNELVGDIPLSKEHATNFSSTLYEFVSQTGSNQKTVLFIAINDKYFADEFLDFIRPLAENLPNKLFIYFVIGNNKLHDTLHYRMEPDYYWNHPTDLGSDLYFLSRNHPSSSIEHFTSNEISLLLRLWSLSDVAIPLGKMALQFLSQYSHQEISILLNNEEFSFTLNNSDKYDAEYKLYRELAFHYSNTNNLEEANHCKDKALSAIDKSSVSDLVKTKYKGLVWGDCAQFEKRRSNISGAIKSLITQKSVYESDEIHFINDLAVVAHNLGVCYRVSGNYTRALVELNLSLELGRKGNELNGEINTLLELGKTYVDLKDYQNALIYFKQVENSLPENLDAGFLYMKGTALAYIIHLNKELGISENLLPLTEKALQIFSALGANEDMKKLRGIL